MMANAYTATPPQAGMVMAHPGHNALAPGTYTMYPQGMPGQQMGMMPMGPVVVMMPPSGASMPQQMAMQAAAGGGATFMAVNQSVHGMPSYGHPQVMMHNPGIPNGVHQVNVDTNM